MRKKLLIVFAVVVALGGIIYPITTRSTIDAADGDGIFSPDQSISWVELTSARTENTKIYYDESNPAHQKAEQFTSAIHYQVDPDNPNDPWLDIDTTIVPSDLQNWDWEVVKNNWQLRIKNDGTIAILKGGYWIGFRMVGFAYLEMTTKDYTILRTTNTVTPSVDGNSITWTGIVDGVNLTLNVGNGLLKEDVEITQTARDWCSAHPPSSYGYVNADTYLVMVYECDWSGSAQLQEDDGTVIDPDLWEGSNIFLKDTVKDKVIGLLPLGNAYPKGASSIDDMVNMRQRLINSSGTNYLLMGVPVLTLNSMPSGSIIYDPSYTEQPASKDTFMYQAAATSNYGGYAKIEINRYSGYIMRGLITFDISGMDDGVTITDATLSLYYYDNDGYDPVGTDVAVHRLRRYDWVEAQATWNIYKTGSNWGTAGAGNTSTDVDESIEAITAMPADYGWVDWDVQAHVEDAIDNHSDIVNMRIKFDGESAITDQAWFYSSDYTVDTDLCPKLVIEYTTSGAAYQPRQGFSVFPGSPIL